MWEIVLDSVVPAIILGIFATVISIVLTEKFSSNKDKKEKQYILLKEIYGVLFDEYKNLENATSPKEENDSETDAVELYTNARISSYNTATMQFEIMQKSLKKIRFVFTENELKDLDCKIKELDKISEKMTISKIYYALQLKENSEDLKFNYNIDELYPLEDFEKVMMDFATKVNSLYDDYTFFVEKKLRSLIH